MVRNPLGLSTVVACALTGLMLAGCGTPNPTATPSPTPTPSSVASPQPPIPTPTPTPSLSAGAQAAVVAVEAALALYDRIAADPAADISELATVARDSAYLTWASWLAEYRSNEWVGTGTQATTLMRTEPGADAREWVVTLCVDNSQTDMLDQNGNSVTSKEAPTRTVGVFKVVQDPTMFGWFVTAFESTGTC